MNSKTIDAISAQALNEISVARTFKQGKIKNWALNELMYYGKAVKSVESRSSVQLSRMQEFVHTLLSKIDNPLLFKFTKRKNAQSVRVELLNALRQIDAKEDHWDIKDIVGKKQGIIYGRAIYSYYADSVDGFYRPHLSNVDTYDFLVDPSAGGIDLEQGRFLGDYSVILDKKQIAQGAKDGIYIKQAAKQLIDGSGNANQMTQEQTNKISRTNDQNTFGRGISNVSTDKFRFWRWYTTYEGDRYYLLMDNSGLVLRCEAMEDVLPTSADYKQGMWPYWSWAAFPDLTEFWTPSYCDYVREIFMAQDVTINQMLDNVEAINKPQKVVNVSAIDDLASLKYRRDGIIKIKGDLDVQRAIQFVQTPSVETPIKVFELLEQIQEKASGVSAQAKGVDDTTGKVGIYQGNEAATADRFGLLNKSYSFGYERFARLWEFGVRDNLVRRVAVEKVGPDGIELVEIKRSDLFRKGDRYGIMVEASNAELLASAQAREAKNTFLTNQLAKPVPTINAQEATEIQAQIAGFSQDEIDRLMDMSVYGNSEIIAKADRDIESVLNGETIRPNASANNAYKQRLVNYLRDHQDDLSDSDFRAISDYITSIEPVVAKNMARALQAEQIAAMSAAPSSGPSPMGGPSPGAGGHQPLVPQIPTGIPPAEITATKPLK